MEIKNPIYQDIEFEQIYHLFTRVSGNETIFRKEGNYTYFLSQVSKYLLPYSEIYAYCLAPQRFSFLVCFKSKKEILKNLNLLDKDFTKSDEHKFLMQPLSNLLNSYAKAYNKMFQRKGALFIDYIKREKLDDEESLKNTLREIHCIPIQNLLAKNPEDWKFSSYNAYLSPDKPSKVSTTFLRGFFADLDEFKKFHINKTNKTS